ncbi:MAG: hypothetical protein V7784_05035 [Oceanospirillaceae bacterium]
MHNILSGIYTISDDELFRLLALMKDTQQLELEPSALAGVIGMQKLLSEGSKYITEQNDSHCLGYRWEYGSTTRAR